MPKYAVIMRFNGAADENLNRLKECARKGGAFDGTAGWPPHITVGAYEDAEEAALRQWTKEYAGKHERFRFSFTSLGVFHDPVRFADTDVIYAVPSAPKALTEFYYGFHEKFDEFSGVIGRSYAMTYGQPALHASITLCKSADFNRLFKSLYSIFSPFEAIVTALELYALPMRLLDRAELKPRTRLKGTDDPSPNPPQL